MQCSIRVYAREWLNNDEFRKISSLFKYLGRVNGKSVFEVELAKLRRKGFDIDDIINYIKDYNLSFLDKESETCFKEYVKAEKTVYLEIVQKGVLVKSKRMLKPFLEDLKGYIYYSRDLKGYIVLPIKFFELKERLGAFGFEIVDKTNIAETYSLPTTLRFYGELRDYQKEAIDAWKKHGYKGIIALPTGSGKTIIGIAAITTLNERTIVVTYTREQLFQWIDKILEFTNADKSLVGAYYSDEKSVKPITVTTYQTAYRHLHMLSHLYSLVIVDEVHHLPAEKFKFIALNTYATKRMGLSATVYREDGRHEELFPLMGGVVYYKSPADLVEKGFLAPYIIRQVSVDLTPDEKKRYNELRKRYRELAGGKSFNEILNEALKGHSKAQEALSLHNKIQQLIHMAKNKLTKVYEIAKMELFKGNKIIIFTQYVEQAKRISQMLNAPILYGDLEPRERRRILEDFKRSSTGILVVTTVGDEGVDIPDANVGIIVAGTGSRRQFIQRLGRLLRPQAEKKAVLYEIIVRNTVEEHWAKKRKSLEL